MSAPVQLERRMFPRKEAAYYIGISLRSLDTLAAEGQILKTKIAGRTVYDRSDLDAYIERVKRAS